MKRRNGFTAAPMPKNRLGALYMIWKRKLRKIDENLLISLIAMAILLLQVFAIVTAVSAQEKPKELKIGERVPDTVLNAIINSEKHSVSLASRTRKPIILYFWGTNCSAAKASLPKVVTLQKQFQNNIDILPITQENRTHVLKALVKDPVPGKFEFFSVGGSSPVIQSFPHNTIPHVVWINSEGIVSAITEGEYLKAENVRKFLSGEPLNWNVKINTGDFDYTKRLFNTSGKPCLANTTIAGYTPGAGMRVGTKVEDTQKRFYAINLSLLHLYALAYKSGLPFQHNRRILQASDTSNYLYKGSGYYDEWRKKHCYTYEATVTAAVSDDRIRSQMGASLDFAFNVKTGIEQRLVKCLVLSCNSDTLNHLSADTTLEAISSADLVFELNKIPGMPPVINECREQLSILLAELQLNDIEAVNRALQKQGLKLQSTERWLDMFVLTELSAPGSKANNPNLNP